jgi:hypothetical protein
MPLLLPDEVATEVKPLRPAVMENELELGVIVTNDGVATIAGLPAPWARPRLRNRRGPEDPGVQSRSDRGSNACTPLGIGSAVHHTYQ